MSGLLNRLEKVMTSWTPMAQALSSIINKMDPIKQKILWMTMDSISMSKQQPIEWKNISLPTFHLSDCWYPNKINISRNHICTNQIPHLKIGYRGQQRISNGQEAIQDILYFPSQMLIESTLRAHPIRLWAHPLRLWSKGDSLQFLMSVPTFTPHL